MIVVSLKYVTLVLRANNLGEGGIMALLALATASVKNHPQWTSLDPMETSFFVSRQQIVPIADNHGMAFWRERIFASMARNAGSITDHFNIPTDRVVELGTGVEI